MTSQPEPISRPLWFDAAAFSARAHRHQLRKDGRTPYAAHPMRVAMTVLSVFGVDDEIALAAAMLHDVIEDTDRDYDSVFNRFGPEIADTVAALTKNMILPEAKREADYDARLAASTWRARLVKLADVYDNMLDLAPAERESRGGYAARAGRACDRATRAIALASVDEQSARACELVGELRDRVVAAIDAGR
jgi:(p)ppGpp synthase/HD superfamily hydrolase